jgi:hypothetical protein
LNEVKSAEAFARRRVLPDFAVLNPGYGLP